MRCSVLSRVAAATAGGAAAAALALWAAVLVTAPPALSTPFLARGVTELRLAVPAGSNDYVGGLSFYVLGEPSDDDCESHPLHVRPPRQVALIPGGVDSRCAGPATSLTEKEVFGLQDLAFYRFPVDQDRHVVSGTYHFTSKNRFWVVEGRWPRGALANSITVVGLVAVAATLTVVSVAVGCGSICLVIANPEQTVNCPKVLGKELPVNFVVGRPVTFEGV